MRLALAGERADNPGVMDAALQFLPTPAGLSLAALGIVLGAPLFSGGLRAMRLRRHLARLRLDPLGASTDGFTHARGRVALESPLFAPLSAVACAGFRLEIAAEGRPVRRAIEERRSFRLVDGGVTARVPAAGRWECGVTATRRLAPGDPLSENLAALLARVPEVAWLRRMGVALTLTERALPAESECHVVGVARSAAALAYAESVQLERTGTDDVVAVSPAAEARAGFPVPVPVVAAANVAAGSAPAVGFSGGDHLEFLLVSDREPEPEWLRVPAWKTAGLVLGPALSLAGIFYLAAVGDALRAAGRL